MVHSLLYVHARPWFVVAALAATGSGAFDRTPLGPVPAVAATVSAAAPDVQPDSASGCFTPKFTVTLAMVGYETFAGVIDGDIEGTIVLTFPGINRFTGVTIANFGSAQWEVSGGSLPGVVAFETAFDNRNLATDRPGSPGWLFENIGRHRAVDGIAKANLAYAGTFSALTLQGVHEYQGVICS